MSKRECQEKCVVSVLLLHKNGLQTKHTYIHKSWCKRTVHTCMAISGNHVNFYQISNVKILIFYTFPYSSKCNLTLLVKNITRVKAHHMQVVPDLLNIGDGQMVLYRN